MKYSIFALGAALVAAQSTTNTYTTDLNGRRVDAATAVSSDHQQTQIARNLNGRTIPLEQTEERVLRHEGDTTVRERIVRKFDRNGQLASTERQVIEEQARPNGSTVHTTTYRTDVNGQMREAERETVETATQGAITHRDTAIERPTIGGGFGVVEKRKSVAETANGSTHEDQTVYRASGNGGFAVAQREVKDTTQSGNQTTEKTALYQPIATSSQLQLTEQTVSKTVARPDGSEVKEVNLYGSSWDGRAVDSAAGPQLREQQIVERTPGAGGSVTESLSVRQPSVSDPNRLGAPRKISETVCTGKCGEAKQ